MVEHLNMALGFHVQRLIHGRLADEDGDCAVKHVDFLVRVINHALGDKEATEEMTTQLMMTSVETISTSLILFS